jgi:NtrC-family two-component system response regulator AlgB
MVTVSARAGDGIVTFSVLDTEGRIPASHLKDILEQFFRVPGQITEKGLGLGLSIAQEIITKHGGTMNVEGHEGQGSVFQFTLPTIDGLDLIQPLCASSSWVKIVIITAAYSSIETAIEVMRGRADDDIPKPFTPAQVRLVVEKIAKVRSLEQSLSSMQEELGSSGPEIDFVSANPETQRAVNLARQVAPTEATILIRGESGTGKTILARQIHYWSDRASKPFGVISCPTLSSELMESELFGHVKEAFTGAVRDNPGHITACEGGTLFLDEISKLRLSVQPKLLRFLQDRKYQPMGSHKTRKANVRIISASNVDLEHAVESASLREDLFHWLNVIQIDIPPLRERSQDIVALAEKFLTFFSRKYHRTLSGFTDEAIEVLQEYPWPGNLRELRNVIERAAILCSTNRVGTDHLPNEMMSSDTTPQVGDPVSLNKIEEEHIRRILASGKSFQETAGILGIDQATLWRRRKQYGI